MEELAQELCHICTSVQQGRSLVHFRGHLLLCYCRDTQAFTPDLILPHENKEEFPPEGQTAPKPPP